ncbi:hypothetical protein CIB48_g2249 [Xylaria polymorpha]|nr:hypothetical protein CIB48_g2249 [Xylaria polymorpha]
MRFNDCSDDEESYSGYGSAHTLEKAVRDPMNAANDVERPRLVARTSRQRLPQRPSLVRGRPPNTLTPTSRTRTRMAWGQRTRHDNTRAPSGLTWELRGYVDIPSIHPSS